jgi:RNA polymerase sigma-70 factor (ECF subfamily)
MAATLRLFVVPRAAPAAADGLEARSDDQLMALSRSGLESAFEVLIRRHQGRMLRLAMRYLGSPSLAADVAQDTFVAVFRALPKYQAHGRFSSYLYRVLLSRCHMVWRSRRTEQRVLTLASVDASEIDEAELLLREQRRDLTVALGKLSEKLRSVVLLRYSADLSLDEIAVALEIPLGTVKRRLFDAMALLREHLEGA